MSHKNGGHTSNRMAHINSWDKYKLLLWKNWILQWHNKLQLLLELLLPPVFSLLLVLVRVLVAVEDKPVTLYPALNISNLNILNNSLSRMPSDVKLPTFALLYSPTNPYLENIVKSAVENLQLAGYQGYPDAKALQYALVTGNYLAGVQFDDAMANITAYPDKFSFALRFPSELRTAISNTVINWMTMRLFPVNDYLGPRNSDVPDGGIPVGYLQEGFLPIQNALSMAYLKLAGGVNSLPDVEMQRFPYPAYVDDPLLEGLSAVISLIILLSFIYPCTSVTRYITSEKEKQLKEIMKIMGLNNWIHWTAWFTKSFIMLGISSIFVTLIVKIKWGENGAVFTYSDWSAILFFFLVYSITITCFCFMLATFFAKASTAAAVTGLIWFIAYIPYSFTINTYDQLSLADKLGWSLLCNTGLGYAVRAIVDYEGTGEGLQWGNMFKAVSVDDSLSLGGVVVMMFISCVIYMTICLYIEQIFPGEYGVPKKWYFPFTRTYWCGEKDNIGISDMPQNGVQRRNPEAFEAEPVGKHVGLQVKDLRKKFGDKMAVKGLSMNMYQDEITVLLGHNGAGKTTTISMLTGMFPPTTGTAIINGSDIRTNTEGARKSLGICPQHNVLFDDMTVSDHLIFFGSLKGLKGDDLKNEVDKYLKMIQLEDKADVASKKLSGGMKRKLSVCCALCGDTKVVLCDEPSSGLDPAARRQLWDLLQAEKTGRTLLLTTHFMDEADVLGDRIAIMSDGELKCYGTSFFLKKKYGSGYHLICVKRENCNVGEVTALLQQFIPGVQPESDIGAELSYQLPDSYSPVFEEMFRSLEEASEALKLNGYGISISSMEEVFMKVGAENAANGSFKQQKTIMNGGSDYAEGDAEYRKTDNIFCGNDTLLQGKSLLANQWYAMMYKKMLYTYRNKLLFVLQNLIPICFVIITVIIATTQGTFSALKPMTMSLRQYPLVVTVLENASSVEVGSLEARVADQYRSIASSYGGDYTFALTGEQNFQDYILDLGQTFQVRINSRYLAAATVAKGKITAWLNNQPYHTAPLTVNLVHTAMAKILIGPTAEITVTNSPLPYKTETILKQLNTGNNLGTQLSTNLCFCMCFVSAFYILFLIKERESRSKLLQFVGGVNVWVFWLTQLLWDIITYLITAVAIILTLACFQEFGYSTFPELGRNFLVYIVFGFAMLPFTYYISFWFNEPAIGFARVSVINIFTGMALFIVVSVMSFDFFETKQAADILVWFCRVFPHFALAMGMTKLYENVATRDACSNIDIISLPEDERCAIAPKCCTPTAPYFSWETPGVLPDLTYMVVIGVFLFLIIIIREYGLIKELIYNMRKKTFVPPPPPEDGYHDEDVESEKKRIIDMTSDKLAGQNLVLDHVTKYYDDFLAVNQISLCVKENECFGLLGVNGAGKTSTFKMMTGDERISSGVAYVKGMNIESQMNHIYKQIGYCPQFDALLDDLTGRETLKIFCLVRGVPKHRITEVSEELAKSFGFFKHIDKETKAYSGGNKRKLSTAIAVIGSPSVIYLDEPTSGMDPAARRQLWNMMSRIRDAGKSIVLTSHSMEECEALCTRLAIMVNGEFKCIGSTQHLKNRFSKGLILKIKVKRDVAVLNMRLSIHNNVQEHEKSTLEKTINIKEFVSLEFPQAILQEEYQGILTFYIPLSSFKWSRVFGLLESNRERLNIEDYSVSQTTLEEIFLQFAKYQRDATQSSNKKQGCCSRRRK